MWIWQTAAHAGRDGDGLLGCSARWMMNVILLYQSTNGFEKQRRVATAYEISFQLVKQAPGNTGFKARQVL